MSWDSRRLACEQEATALRAQTREQRADEALALVRELAALEIDYDGRAYIEALRDRARHFLKQQ